MSSMYPPYSGASARRCQRCGRPLAPSQVQCGTCGEYNVPAPTNGVTTGTQLSTSKPWAGPAPQAPYAAPPPVQPGQNTYFEGNYASPPQHTMYPNNPYAVPQPPPYSILAPPSIAGFEQNALNGYQNAYNPSRNYQPPTSKRGSLNIGLIIGVLILLVILVGGGVGYFYVKSQGSKVTTIPATPTPSGPPLFSDTFQNNNNGWDLTSVAGKYSVKVGGGSMALEDDDNKLLWELIPGTKPYGNFKLTVNANLSRGDQNNGYGVYIRGASNQNSELATYYRFELYGDGSYTIFKGVVDANGNSQSQELVNNTLNPAIQKQGTVNQITVIANGPSMILIVNGQTLTTVSDSSYTNGSVALFVSNLPAPTPPGAQATFTDLALYPV